MPPPIAKIEIALNHDGKIAWVTNGPPPEQTMFWYGLLEVVKDEIRASLANKALAKIQAPTSDAVLEFGVRR